MTQEQPEALIAEYRPSMPHEVLHDWANDAVAELRRLHAENEALRKNDARYRWLRTDRYVDGVGVELAAYTDDLTWNHPECAHQPIFEDKLDAAIDAAMKGQS